MSLKRVVSYSLFGQGEDYHRGALENCALAQTIYPGWTCRVYISDQFPGATADRLTDAGAEVVVMQQTASYDGLFWRFLPAVDDDVDATIVRDADARLGAREKASVDEWIASGKILHIMRDHPGHRRLIPAGLWGCRGNAIPDMRELLKKFGETNGFDNRLGDADFLEQNVYTRFRGNLHLHSGFSYYAGETPNPFPVERNGNEYLGCPVGRGELRQRRLDGFTRHKSQGLTLRQLPEWMHHPT